MAGKVIRFRDYERTRHDADAVQRDPADTCIIIFLPVIKIERMNPESPRARRQNLKRKRGSR